MMRVRDSDVISSPRRYSDFSSSLHTQNLALGLSVGQRTLGESESKRAKSKKDELCFLRLTARFISRPPMFFRSKSEGEEMPWIHKFLICYTVHIFLLLIYNKLILAVANSLR